MSKKKLIRLSKFLALILRHRASEFHITLDQEGFADLNAVWEQVQKRFPNVFSREDLQRIVEGKTDGKKRFEIRADRIRALYGHSQVREIQYPKVSPPETLFHGTHPGALPGIQKEGLRPMGRQYVHLSTTPERAVQVGSRRANSPIVLRVQAREAYESGILFYNPEPQHYLTKIIPPRFIEFPTSPHS